ELIQYLRRDVLQIIEIADHHGARIDLSREGHLQQVIMPMARLVVAGSEYHPVPCRIPGVILISMRGGEFDPLGQEDFGHLRTLSMKKGPGSRLTALVNDPGPCLERQLD